jgi:hypothetical protein
MAWCIPALRIMVSMRRMRRASILIVTAVMLAAPGPAMALSLTPPGSSGADQYFETVPSSGGNAAPPHGTSPGSKAFRHLGQGATGDARLSHLGTTGAAAAALAAATAPTPASSSGNGSGSASGSGNTGGSPAGRSGAGQVTITQPSGQSGASALANALSGSNSSGLGFLLPVFLIGALVMAVGFALLRMRHGPQPPDSPA